MKKILLAATVALCALSASAQKYATRSANISFFSKTSVENIQAINHEASAALNAKTGEIMAVVPIRSFKFEKELMQEHFNENYMESGKFPKAEFRGNITNINQVNFSKDGVYPVKAIGKLTMHGVTKEVAMPGTITIKKGVAVLVSDFSVKCADYGIKIPTVVSSKVAESIAVSLNASLNAAK